MLTSFIYRPDRSFCYFCTKDFKTRTPSLALVKTTTTTTAAAVTTTTTTTTTTAAAATATTSVTTTFDSDPQSSSR